MSRSVTTTIGGSVLTTCAVVVAVGAAVPGRRAFVDPATSTRTREYLWYWPVSLWLIIVGLAVAGAFVVARPATRRPAAAAAAVLAGQIAGLSIVGVRDWFNVNGGGMVSLAQHELATRVTVAATMAVAGTIAVCVAVALLWREPQRGWAAWRPRRPWLLVAGTAVAVMLPLPLAYVTGMITTAGAVALAGSLPWGGGLAAAAWLGPRARRTVVRTVLAAASVTVVGLPLPPFTMH